MDSRSLDLTFPFMDEEEMYRSHPSRYIAHLIGHEGPGSILAYLKKKGWANGLSAGPTPVTKGAAFFSIGLKLTEEGLRMSLALPSARPMLISMQKTTRRSPQQSSVILTFSATRNPKSGSLKSSRTWLRWTSSSVRNLRRLSSRRGYLQSCNVRFQGNGFSPQAA